MADEPDAPVEAAAPEPAPEVAAQPVDPKLAKVTEVIAAWRDSRIGGSPIAQRTDCWNWLQAELPNLAAALVKEL